jgi:hypothetical protein
MRHWLKGDTECIAFEFGFSEILENELPFIHWKGKGKLYEEIFPHLRDILVFWLDWVSMPIALFI